jgi:hypothetical protein
MMRQPSIIKPAFRKPLLTSNLEHMRRTEWEMPRRSVVAYYKHMLLMLKVVDRMLETMAPVWDIVGVQPMNGPVGLVYRLKYTQTAEHSLRLEVVSNAVEARTQKMQTCLQLEAMQDMKALRGIDMEAEIVNALGCEAGDEVMDNIVTAIAKMAPVLYDHTISYDDTVEAKLGALLCKINKASNDIARLTRRGAGNIIVTTPLVAALLTKVPHIDFEPIPHSVAGNTALRYVGNIYFGKRGDQTRPVYKVYTSISAALLSENTNSLVVMYKGGSGECDTGLIYTPYIMLGSYGVTVDPTTFSPVMPFIHRSGMHAVDNDSLGNNTVNYMVKIDISFPTV